MRFIRDTRGVIAIEAVFVLPVFLALLAVSAELGLAQLGKQSLVYATQVAAQMQAHGQDYSGAFSTNVASTPASAATIACSTSGQTAQCTGAVTIRNIFSGLLNSSDWNFTYTAMAQVAS